MLSGIWRTVYGLAAVMFAVPGLAQALDPRVLQQLQGQLGAQVGTAQTQNPIDAARGDAARDASELRGTRLDTPEEQELRRQESRAALQRLYRPTPVEREFRERLADPTLRQFGYDVFQVAQGEAGGLTGAVSDSYVVGIGDELVVQFQGATNDSRTVRVDREGRLTVGLLPPVPAAGRSLGLIRRDLAAATRRTLLGTEVYISLGAVRAITVFVGGEVDRPGQVNLTALADISAALAQAGGVRRSGSLRRVRVVRSGGGTVIVDLYGLLGIGAPPSVRLRDGDRIIVPVIGDTVAIAGNVARPGIYEILGRSSVGALLDYAGGALRPRGNQIAISRIDAEGSEQFVRAATLASAVQPGDAIQLTGGSAGGAQGRVILRGYVANPGPRSLGQAPTVRDLLGDIADLRFDTYLPMAVLVRRDATTASRQFEPVNLLTALRSRPGVALRSDDRLYVFSRSDIDFLNRTAVRRVVLGQPSGLAQCASLDRLEALVRDTQSSRFGVVTRGAFVVERGGQNEVAATGGALAQGARRGEETFRAGDDRVGIAAAQARSVPDPALSDDGLPPGAVESARGRVDTGPCPAVFEEEPELLPVLIENAVAVSGAVRRPGAYPIAASVSAGELASVAEGVLTNASAMTLDVTRASGEVVAQQRLAVDRGGVALASTTVRAGDDLRFNAAQPQFESGGVLLTGEFLRPGLYSIRKGETLSQLIARAGGLSSLAYPYGTVFTRRSVKEAQQEGFRRTGRELTNALLAVSARKETSGEALIAASGLIGQLSTVEAPGRVVIEADPRALAIRPDLDTVLESGDAVYVPKRPNFVLALGDVSNPGALQFVPGKPARAYLAETGGTQSSADDGRVFVILPNGTAQPLRGGNWRRGTGGGVIPPGSTIIVPKDIDPLFTLDLIRDVTGIIGSLLTSVATVAILATN